MMVRRPRRRTVRTVRISLACALVAGVSALVGPLAGPAHAAGVGGIVISEVAPWGSGSSTYAVDWFEVTNTGSAAVNITGWRMDDNSNAFGLSVALNGISTIAAGESVVFMETATPATTFPLFTSAWFGTSVPPGLQLGSYSGSGVGLGTGGDAVNLFNAGGVLQAKVTFGASSSTAPFASFDNASGLDNATISTLSSPTVNGAFLVCTGTPAIGSPGTILTTASTPTTTSCASGTTTTTSVAPTGEPWPGPQTVSNASTYAFGTNLSGLIEEPSGTSAPGVLWAVRNGVGTMYRLLWDGTNWSPDSTNGWAAGKDLHYTDGTGDPDAEGVTYAASPANGMFVSTERNNLNGTVSKLSILRFDPNAAGAALTATNDWDLTTDLPATGSNLGLEAITWIPDSYLTANNLFDEHTLAAYNPASYANHGTGLFFVGVEGSGKLYGYALDLTSNTFTRVVSIANPFVSIMELQFDRDLNELWAVCDNTCNGQHAILRLDPLTGKFVKSLTYERPTGMPNYNNEGFALGAGAECVNNLKPVSYTHLTLPTNREV